MKVSIIVPVYNGEAYLGACLKSLLKQTLDEYEIICVNDGSTDRSLEMLEKYQKLFPEKLRVISRENKGAWRARETGIQAARGTYVGFCDCDDTVSPQMLEIMYGKAVQTKADMVVCAYDRISGKQPGRKQSEMTVFGDRTYGLPERRDILPVVNTGLCNKLIRKEILGRHIAFEKPPRVAEDMMFLLSIYPFVKRISFVKESLYQYYIRSTSAFSHVSQAELSMHRKQMEKVRDYVLAAGGPSWSDIVGQFAMIHFGLSLVLRLDFKSVNQKQVLRAATGWLDRNFSGWKKNPYLKFSYVVRGHRYLWKPAVVRMVFQMGLVAPFIRVYLLASEKLGVEIKW
ncbi:MAG: glycosyltransferase [Lachnospiraceae bacterium]|nr:glycosyltransferase [Lachnospiraceae bacterium]